MDANITRKILRGNISLFFFISMIYTRAKPRPRLSNRLHFQLKIIFRKPPIWQYSAERTTIYSKNKTYDWLNWKKRRSVILFSTIMNNLNALKIISRFNLNTIPFPWRGRKSKYLRSTCGQMRIYIYIYDTCNKRLPYQPQPGTVSNQFSTWRHTPLLW